MVNAIVDSIAMSVLAAERSNNDGANELRDGTNYGSLSSLLPLHLQLMIAYWESPMQRETLIPVLPPQNH